MDEPLDDFELGRRNFPDLEDCRKATGSYGLGAFRGLLLIIELLAELLVSRRTGLRTIGSSGTSWPCIGSAPFNTSGAIEYTAPRALLSLSI